MAIIFCDGFDAYTTVTDKWDRTVDLASSSATPIPTIVAGAGRGGAGALLINGGHLSSSAIQSQVQKNIGAQGTLYIGFACNWTQGSSAGDHVLCMFQDASTVQVALWITQTGTLYVTRGAAIATNVLGTAGSSYPVGSYHYIEVLVTIGSSTGAVTVRVDQTNVINVSSVNTKASSNSTFDSVLLGDYTPGPPSTSNAYVTYFDDVYFNTAAFLGDYRVNGQLASGNGSTQNFSMVEAAWVSSTVTKLGTTIIDSNGNLQRCTAITSDFKTGTPTHPTWATTPVGTTTTDNHVTWTLLGSPSHYLLVNEPDPDGDSSYLQSSTVGDIERFTFPPIAGANIATVVLWAYARKDDGGFRTIQGAIKSGATVGTTGTDVSPGTNYSYLMLQSATDPNTGSAWTISGVNAAEIGVKITN